MASTQNGEVLRGYAATSSMLGAFSPPSSGRAFGALSFHSVVCKKMHLGGLLVQSAWERGDSASPLSWT